MIILLSLIFQMTEAAFCSSAAVKNSPYITGADYILIGKTYRFRLHRKPAGGTCAWSADKARIRVTQDGRVKGLHKGPAFIVCKIRADGRTYTCRTRVTVIKPAASVTIKNPIAALYTGECYDFNRTVFPAASNDKTFWKTSDASIAWPDPTGKITALKAGIVIITARTLSGKKDSVRIQVLDPASSNTPPPVPARGEESANPPHTSPERGSTGYADKIDTDRDGLPDELEKELGTNRRMADTDGDGLTNEEEIRLGTSPIHSDTDGDGISDSEEVNRYYSNPLRPDTDNDGLEDGDEVKLGFDPGKADTDGNGIPDVQEKVSQTLTVQIEEEDKPEVTEVQIQLSAAGNLEKEASIENVYDLDVYSSHVAGVVGAPVEISAAVPFEEAKITFTYDGTKLGSTEEENLRLMWYDEENGQYRLMDEESIVDTENHTVTITTDHFSTWLLADRSIWYQIWEENGTKRQELKDSVNLLIYMDVSVSMDEALYRKQEAVIKKLAQNMGESDRAYLYGTGSDLENMILHPLSRDELIEKVEEVTGDLIEYGVLTDNDMTATMLNASRLPDRILLATGLHISQTLIFSSGRMIPACSGYDYESIERLNKGGTSLSMIKVGLFDDNGYLKKLAETGEKPGIYCEINDPEEFSPAPFFVRPDLTDTDGDGLLDVFERMGMMLSNGETVYSDPFAADTDGDGIKDGDEMGAVRNTELWIWGVPRLVQCFGMYSNPGALDTDHDGIGDTDDADPKKSFCGKARGSVDKQKRFRRFIVKNISSRNELRSRYADDRLEKERALFHTQWQSYMKNEKYYEKCLKQAYLTVYAGRWMSLEKAYTFLEHYLDRSGTLMTTEIFSLLSAKTGQDYLTKNVNSLLTACEKGIKSGSTVSIATNPEVKFGGTQFDETLWYALTHFNEFLSVNCTDALMNATCTNDKGRYKIKLTYYITDVYDWDKDNNAPVYFTSSSKLYDLKLIGAAMDFEVRGCIDFSFEWRQGEKIGNGLVFKNGRISNE